jgi:uncharacterized protein YbjT (DUF2867 family)
MRRSGWFGRERRHWLALGALLALGAGMPRHAAAQEGAPKPPPVLPSMRGETVLVAGATGRTGKVVVQLLRAQGVKVRGFSRNVDAARAAMPDVEWVAADVRDPGSLEGLARGADRMVIALGSNSFRDPANRPEEVDDAGVARLAALAKAASLKHVVLVSSAGVTRAQPGEGRFAKLMYGVMTAKLRGEDALRRSGVPYTVLRPVGLWDKPPGEYGIALVPGDPPISAMISRSDVAAVAVHALVDPAARNKTVVILNAAQQQVDGWKSAFAALPEP